jgi:hypothetical protein
MRWGHPIGDGFAASDCSIDWQHLVVREAPTNAVDRRVLQSSSQILFLQNEFSSLAVI